MNPKDIDEKEWKQKLTKEEYHVLREGGTEPPFSDKNLHGHEDGIYSCAACGAPLFASQTKYNSGSGWPSFYKSLDTQNVSYHEDFKLDSKRIEVKCAHCNSHLGHVFDDGPLPTCKRYCINSIALKFKRNNNK